MFELGDRGSGTNPIVQMFGAVWKDWRGQFARFISPALWFVGATLASHLTAESRVIQAVQPQAVALARRAAPDIAARPRTAVRSVLPQCR